MNKKQIKAIELAIEALDMGCRNDIQAKESGEAIDILNDMLISSEKIKKRRRRILK